MPIIISTKEVLRHIYSNSHGLPKIKKGSFSKNSNFGKMPINFNFSPNKPFSPDNKSHQYRISNKEEERHIMLSTGIQFSGHQKKMAKQFEEIKI
jgi:hypothetical protein